MRISLDAGHGINTPGKRSIDGSLREFQFNSGVADMMYDLLLKYDDVQVQMVHDPLGYDVPLSDRVKKANDWKSDIYVSIHANAYGTSWNNASGIETYIHSSTPKEALILASDVQTQMIRATGLKNRGVKKSDFYVLKNTDMTAILCECGFMTNKDENELLKSSAYKQKIASAIVQGIANTYNLVPKPKTKTPTTDKKLYRVQVGVFESRTNAIALQKQLNIDGYDSILILE